jgi:hypothetical protein
MDNLEKLYNVLKRDGFITKSFDEFVDQATQDSDYQDKIFNVVSREDLFTGSPDEFSKKYFSELATSPVEEVKKKDDSQPTGEEEVMVSDTEVVDERGSSEPSVQINSEEEIVDPETLGEIEQIQEVPNRFGADTPKEEMFLHDDEIAIGVQPGEEDTTIEEIFGKNEFTDFFGDMWRAGAQGQAQGGTVDESLELLMKGGNASQNDIEEFLISYQAMQRAGVSDEMNAFNKIYQKDGGGILGFIKGVAANPTVVPQLFISSVSAMVNPTVLAAATAGAVAGSVIPGAGTIAGGMFAAGTTLETALTFGELLEEALDGEPMTNANIRSVLEDAEKMSSIRMKALGRGLAIGAIDGLTGGLATKLTTSVAKATSKAGKTVSRLTAATAGGTLEAVGGSTGEVVGRLVAGQEMDVAEILFEGVAGTATAPITVGAGLLNAARKPPVYEMNKGPATRADIIELLESDDTDAILDAEVSVENDPELSKQVEAAKKKILDKKVLNRDLKDAGITDQNAIDEMTALEEEAEALKGNNTRAGKRRLAEINQRIDDILDTAAVEQEVEVTIEDKVTTESERLAALEETLEGKDLEVLQLMRDKNKSQDMIDNHIKNKAKNTGKGNQLSTKFKAEDTLLNPEGKSFAELVSAYSLIFEGKNLPVKTIQDILADTPDLRDLNLGNTNRFYPLQQAILNFESYQNKKNNQKTKQDAIQEVSVEEQEVEIQKERDDYEKKYFTLDEENQKNKDKGETYSYSAENLNEGFTLEEAQEAKRVMEAKHDNLLKTKTEQNAIQESSTESVDVQEPTESSTEVGDGNTQRNATQESIESEADTETQSQEEVETVTENSDGTLSIPNPKTGKVAKLKGKKIGETSNLYISDMISENIDPSYEGNTEAKTKQENYITKIAIKAAKSIAKLLPNTNIILHSTEASYNKGAGQVSQIYTRKKGSRGVFKPTTNDIHINMTHANAKTIAHEIFHALLYNKFKSDERIGIVTYKMVESIKKKITDPKLKKQLQKFSDNYTETPQFQDEEYLAELIGTLADNYKSLKRPEKTIVQKWLNKLKNIMGMEAEVIDTDADTLDLLATIAENIKEGKEITESDISQLDTFEQGEGGEVGVLNFSDKESKINPAPKVESDSRPFSSLIKNKDISDFDGQNFVTNMYDFTTAGIVDIGNGITLQLEGGKSYVPLMMSRKGLKIGDVSNLAAFNTKSQAEGFIRNSQEGNAKLFMPHSGTLEGSWQFQQSIFEQIIKVILDNKIVTNKELISSLSKGLVNKKGKEIKEWRIFKENYKKATGKDINNLDSFVKDPLQLVKLLDIENNYSPDLRKRFNSLVISIKKFKDATGVTSKTDFALKIMDPLNEGIEAFDLMSVIEFDNTTFEISKPKKGDVDYHPSFAWTIKAKIKGIYQPTNFQKSYDITDSYVKYNQEGPSKSTRDNKLEREYGLALKGKKINDKGKVVKRSKSEIGGEFYEGTYPEFQEYKFQVSNVASSAGSIPKVAKVNNTTDKAQKLTTEEVYSEIGMTTDEVKAWKKDNNKSIKMPHPKAALEAANSYSNGDITLNEYNEIIQKEMPITPYTKVPKPATIKDVVLALQPNKVQKGIIGLTTEIKDGEKVSSRLDIPSYQSHGIYVDTIHGPKGKGVLGYGQTAVLKNVEFTSNAKKALGVAKGTQSKSPFAVMDGSYVNESTESATKRAQEALNSNEWVQVGFNPYRQASFYNKADSRPVTSAAEIIQVGPLVMAKGVKYGKPLKISPDGNERFQLVDDYSVKETGQGEFTLMKGIRRAGEMSIAELQSDKPSVSQVYIKKFDQGKGLAPDMYREIANILALKGKILTSSKFTNNASQGVWKRLVKDGDAIVIGSRIDAEGKKRDLYSMLPTDPLLEGVSNEREQKTTPDSIEGYNRMIKEVENIISKSEKRGVKFNDISKNVINYIQGSKVYEIATDIQREDIIRDVRAKFGIKEKAAPSVKNVIGKAMSVLFGETKEIKKFTVTEKQLLIQRLKQLNEGAKTAKKSFMKASKELADGVSEMVSIGKISTKQAAAVIKRFSKVNMFNEASIERFVDYMAKVFANAEYAEQIAFARKKVKQANKNIRTKLGIATDLINPLQRLFSIDPTLIPDSVFKKYLSLVEVFGERATVLTLEQKQETLKEVQDVLDKINEEQSQAEEMALIFADYKNKVFNDDGKLNYAETIKAMLEDGKIDEDSAAIMRKYKSDILPQIDAVEKTDEQIQEEKDEVIEEFNNIIMDVSNLPSQDERNLARRLNKLIDTVALDKLNLTQLKNLLKVIDNINNGYLPHYSQLLVEQMNSINDSEKLTDAIGNAKPLLISKFIAKIKTLLTKKKDAYLEMIRRNPLYNIDQLFGNWKGKEIFDSLFSKVAEGVATYNSEYNKIQKKIEKSINDVSKSFKGNPAKTLESSFKQMAYMIQLEFQSNPDSKQVNPASEYMKKTIKAIRDGKSALYTENDAQVLEKILKDFSDKDGNISLEKLDKSFNNAEKNSIKTVREINQSLLPVAEYTSAIIRGDKINPLTNYIHLPVMNESKPIDVTADVVRSFGESLNPSTKAKSLIERTGKVSPINFNIYSSVQKGSKMVLMDRHLTEPIRTARRTLNRTESTLETENGGTIPVEQRKVFNAIKAAFLESSDNLLQNTFTETTIFDDVVNYISKQGYRSVLAGTGRFMAELTSNIGFALMINPKAFKTGINNRGFILSAEAPSVMQNVGSKQTGRIFSGDTLSGKMIDTNILNQSAGTENGRTRGIIANKIQQIYNLSLKKYINFVELTADALISTPDKLVMRPIWFGDFANVFKAEAGVEVDFNKIAANDEAYMKEYSEAIQKAKDAADETSVKTGATDNPFMNVLKGKSKPNQTAFLRAFNNFNGFMMNFLLFEYVTARTGLYAAMGNGTITKKQGIATLAAVTTRMITYTLLTQMLGSGLIGLLFGSDEEEEKKSIGKQIGQAISSAFTSLLIGRDFGNAVKSILNQGVEVFNEEYLDFLREGEYDPYKDSIQYTIVPKKAKEDFRGTGIGDILLRLTGSFGPALKTLDLITKKYTESVKKTPAARMRQVKEITQRIPLEVFGHLGLIPLYKDIRKVVMKKLYKDLRNSDKKVSKKSKSKSKSKTYDSDMFDDSSGMFDD